VKLVFLTVSNKLPPWLSEISEDYKKKLSYWLATDIQVLKASGFGREAREKKKSEESQSLLNFLKADDFVVACDESGKSFNSKDFSAKLEKTLSSGKKRLIFIIGGAYGLEDELINRANIKLSVSSFTLNHHVALALILEQVYRAMTIIKGIKYHNS
jgi:23S rRNA (pseudouridine1915-N3)-methyltransferase